MNNFSVVILTKNEEANILDCLAVLDKVEDIIIVDDFSQDRTAEIIQNLNDKRIRFFKHSLNSDFSEQRNFGLSKAKNEWVLFIDADERVSYELLSEVEEVTSSKNFSFISGYEVKRVDTMWGHTLKYGETGNIYLLRLARKNKGEWVGKVHERWNIKGKVGKLKNSLAHYPHPTIKEFLMEIDYYSTIRAEELHRKGVHTNAFLVIAYPKAKFIHNFFIKLGFMDGIPGLVFALIMSLHSFFVRGKLYLLNNKK